VNDAYGHAVGDAVLCQFADRLRDAASATTLIARHGGDEFIVLLADMLDDAASTTHAHPADVAQMASVIAAVYVASSSGRSCTAGTSST
jgi:diguanylate cyclase (GGDEF)-like protein